MVKRLVACVAILAAVVLWQPRTAEASPIMTLRPGTTQSGAPGDTIGWGYDLVNDSDDILFLVGINASVPLSGGTIDTSIFDFFDFQGYVLPHQELHVDYNPTLAIGLAQLTLSSLLSPGETVTAQIFVDYILGSTFGTFALEPTATVTDTTPVPEPSTLLLLGTGALTFFGRRRLRLVRN